MGLSYLGNNIKDWVRMSPLMSIQNVKTPVLIQQGLSDQCVPIVNSIEIGYALKWLKVPYELTFYKGQQHGFSSDYAKYLAMKDQVAWIKSHIDPYKPRLIEKK